MMACKRLKWLDGMRGLAILWILFVHFVVVFSHNETADFPGFLGLLLFGISGKLAVAGCSVIMGYFASKPASVSLWRYAWRRYITFVIQILLAEGIYLLLTRIPAVNGYALSCVPELSWPLRSLIPLFLKDAFLFEAQLISTYWCVGAFAAGSILTFLLSHFMENKPLWMQMLVCAAAIGGLIQLECTWLAIILMGWALRLLLKCHFPFQKNPLLWIAMLSVVPWMIRRNEGFLTYLLDGAASVIVLYVFSQWKWIQTLLSFRPVAFLGTISLELFIIHVPIFYVLRQIIHPLCALWLPTGVYAVMFAAVMLITIPAAAVWKKMTVKLLPKDPKK